MILASHKRVTLLHFEIGNVMTWINADLARWAALDLPVYRHRRKHPLLSRAELVLTWTCNHFELSNWTDYRPSMLQEFIRAHPRLKPSTLAAYAKAVRRWLRWHERDDLQAPIISTRCARVVPRQESADPYVPDTDTWARLIQRSHWIHAGSRAIHYTVANRSRVPSMADWPRGAFTLWLLLGSDLGLRPWELAFLHRSEIHNLKGCPFIRLENHEARARKTPLAGTPLAIPAATATMLFSYLETVEGPFVFAKRCPHSPSGWRAPNYDQIWAALRQEFGLAALNGRVLRRLHATNVAKANPSVIDVATATRHVRLDTLRHYVQRHGGRVIDPATGRLLEGETEH